jgi:Tfp pilus assembly protein PilV
MSSQIKLNKKIKGISLIEALVSIVIVGVGIVSVLQLSLYAIITTDNAIVKNKANFLAEMMAEDILADRNNIANYKSTFICNQAQGSGTQLSDIIKNKWNINYQNVLGSNKCSVNDVKTSTINNSDSAVNINVHLGEGKQKKYLGIKVK